jgi:hypothetical protein
VLRVTFLASDDTGVESYKLAVIAGKQRLAGASEPGATGRTTRLIRLHASAGTTKLTVELTISDPLGNSATTTKTPALS